MDPHAAGVVDDNATDFQHLVAHGGGLAPGHGGAFCGTSDPGDQDVGQLAQQQPAAAPQQWLAATVAALQGEEFSAFGVSSEDGGIHLVAVPEGSAAAQAGQPLAIDYVRGQGAQSLTVE